MKAGQGTAQAKFCHVHAGEKVQLSSMKQEQKLQNSLCRGELNLVTAQVKLVWRMWLGGRSEPVLQPQGCDSVTCRAGTVCVSLQFLPFYSYSSSCCFQSHSKSTKQTHNFKLERDHSWELCFRTAQWTGISLVCARPGFWSLPELETID